MEGEREVSAKAPIDLGPQCPNCGEPWLRPTNLPGRYRCVYCLHRFELTSVCPNCGEHSTIVRMSSTAILKCNNCGDSNAAGRMNADSPRELLRGTRVAPSILSADFGRLREQVEEVLAAGARVIHVDVMDGHFVPPITLGPIVVAALAETVRAAGAMLDVHLMIERPERQVGEFVKAGAHSLTVHAEATPHLAYAVNQIREGGACVGVAVNPGTPAAAISEVAHELDVALCMSVSPGWGGQPFIAHSLEKIPRLRALVGAGVAVEVDGGIDATTAPACHTVGANLLVAGSAIFAAADPAEAYRAIVLALGAED